MKIGKIDFDTYGCTRIPVEYIKELLIRNYYGLKDSEAVGEKELRIRKLIITEIKDNHGKVSTVVFSVSGSPPKGIGVLLNTEPSLIERAWHGKLYLYGNRKVSKGYLVEIDRKGVEKEELTIINKEGRH